MTIIDEALEGEPIITWTCAVLKECLRSQGGRLTGKKDYLVWRQIVHLVTKGWSVISTESLPAWFFLFWQYKIYKDGQIAHRS